LQQWKTVHLGVRIAKYRDQGLGNRE
jgi:hypothetical protein